MLSEEMNHPKLKKMEKESYVREQRYLNNENLYQTLLNIEKNNQKNEEEVTYGLSAMHGKDFFWYLKNFKLAKDPDLLILPPNNHYYFDENELSHVKTLINLKNLNRIKNLDSFLSTLGRLLPNNGNFLGFFSYNKLNLTADNLFSGLQNRFINFLDLKTDHNLDEQEFSDKLRKYGFRTIDMTEMNGLTFFYCRKYNHSS
jgi:hypothetical protein